MKTEQGSCKIKEQQHKKDHQMVSPDTRRYGAKYRLQDSWSTFASHRSSPGQEKMWRQLASPSNENVLATKYVILLYHLRIQTISVSSW